MGSGASCCCGGKSTDVIATNTDARPWTKDEGTGPDGSPDSSPESPRVCRVVVAPCRPMFVLVLGDYYRYSSGICRKLIVIGDVRRFFHTRLFDIKGTVESFYRYNIINIHYFRYNRLNVRKYKR